MAVYLAFKEMWRNRGRFLLFSMVIALITILVLFISALADGLGNGNKEYIEKLNGELLVYKANVDLSIGASQLDRQRLAAIRRVPGVADAGQISFASVVLLLGESKKLNVALIGVEPGKPGEPPVVQGRGLDDKRGKEAIVDRNVVLRTGYGVGDNLVVKSVQGTKEELYTIKIVGVTDGRQYSLQPAIIVPLPTFDLVRPGAVPNPNPTNLISNIVAVRLTEPTQFTAMAATLEAQVNDVQVADRVAAYKNTPGFSAQQSTLTTQQFFSLLIGMLVIGGFFQIQMLQKVPQVGMLKAIGAANSTIALAALAQIVMVTMVGVAIGTLATLMMAAVFPATVPIVFSPMAIVLGIGAITLIGPVGGFVSVRYALRVEPLTALGLSS